MTTRKITLFLACICMCVGVSAQEWEQLNNPPFYKHHSNGYGYNGKAYIMEGGINNGLSRGVWEYTPETDTWLPLENFPGQARNIAIGDDWEGKYYYGFGLNNTGYLSDLWVFDPEELSFTELPSCPCVGRSHPALIAHNDKIYMGAGSGDGTDLDDWWEYDILTQVWTQKPDIPGGIRHHTFQFTIDDDIYVGGGHVSNWLRYRPSTEEWTLIDDLPQGRVAGTQFSYNGMGYLLGGDNTNHQHIPNVETFMRYDAEMDDWDFLESLPNGSRWAPSSFIIDDVLYFFGGISDFVNNDRSMWKFDLSTLDEPPVSTEDELNEYSSIYTFPNPVQDEVYFGGVTNTDIQYNFQMINVSGQVVLSGKDLNLSNGLDVSMLTQGVYILKLKQEDVSIQLKLVKAK